MNRWLFGSCLLTLASLGVWTWSLFNTSLFPEPVPIHWDINNQPNGWTDAHTAVAWLGLLPAVMLFLVVLEVLITRWPAAAVRASDWTLRANRFLFRIAASDSPLPGLVSAENRRRLDYIVFLVVGLMGWIFVVVFEGMRTRQLKGELLLGAVFVLFGMLGPAMRGLQRNALIGVRTPWTLTDDDIWNRTHAMTAKLWLVVGVLGVLLLVVGAPLWLPLLLFIPAAIWPIVYSYRLYRAKPKKA